MSISTARILDALAAQQPCLGAFFSTFTFDPTFFENNVLRAVLQLASDPTEHPERYHQECRRALQQTPMAVVVDAGERQGGRRLPYDLLEVSKVVFHPKTALLLFRDHARLLVGSGNLTPHGYGSNAELFFCADLSYDTSSDRAVLATFRGHLERIAALTRSRGTQLAMLDEELHRRLGDGANAELPATFRLLDSTVAPVLRQALELLPARAKLRTIGLAAPFFEKDDEEELDASSVFGALLEFAGGKVDIDVAVGWDNVRVHATDPVPLDSGFERLWTWEYEDEGERRQDHVVPISLGPRQLRYRNERGREERWDARKTRQALANRKLWMQPAPVVYAPGHLLAAATEAATELRLWLHPATRLVEGRPQCRPLHAKLLVLGYESAGGRETLVVMGSPNMSRRALLLAAGDGGNVEVAVALRVRGALSLPDLMPGIVRAPVGSASLRERAFPAARTNHALAVERAVHDAQAGTLVVHWSSHAAKLPAWRLHYQSRELASSSLPPTQTLRIAPFVLQPATAELSLRVADQVFAIPILVADLVHLPADATTPPLNLDELLMLASRRVGGERAVQIARQRGQRPPPEGKGTHLDVFFAERFAPTDVFRAWWCAAEDLRNPALSVNGFRLALEGAMGTAAVWAAIRGAADSDHLTPQEAWLYGAELLRSLKEVDLPGADDAEVVAKRQVMNAFRARVRTELEVLMPSASRDRLLRTVRVFYANSSA